MDTRSRTPETAMALGVIALAGLVAFGTTQIPEVAYVQVGPRIFGWIAAAGLGVMGALLLFTAVKGIWQREDPGEALDWPALATIGAGLLINIAFIETVGFILTSTILFAATARAFGSRKWLRDLVIGFALTACAYVFFDKVLEYRIGSGLVEDLLTRLLAPLFPPG